MRSTTKPPSWVTKLDELHLLTPLRIVIVIALAALATLFIRRFVIRLLRNVFSRTASSNDPRANARRKALSSSLRAALVGLVWSTAVITIVSELGINIGAFVAVATVIGGAVGFGAQMLVRDVIAGFFVLADDQYGPGDEVDLGHASGVVERVTLRSARLRDSEGTIWYVPHGNVLRAGNSSKSATGPLDVEVARTMDGEALHDVVSELARVLASDPEVVPMLAGEPKIVGITDLRDDRIVFRVRVPTQPGRIDEVRRAWRILVLRAFAEGDLAAPAATTNVLRFDAPPGTPASGL
jgi:small conductance mechanosensitive channel